MQINCVPLCDLEIGQSGIVHGIHQCGSWQRRMLDLGFIEGTPVKAILHSPSGDPVAYEVRGSVIALRKEQSSQIFVECSPMEEVVPSGSYVSRAGLWR
nr:FeoA family protein [uncultured Solibaculum sp.]